MNAQESPVAAPPAVPPAAPSAAPPAATVPPVSTPAAEPPSTTSNPIPPIRFEFKGASWDQVLDYFARTTGLPVVKETPAPDGTVDYLSPRAYDLPEALQTLNILLQTRGVMLRVENDRLFLQKLDDMKRENIPTFVGKVPAQVTDDQIVTVVLPLLNAEAKPVAEWLSQMVASYGAVTALEKQNAIVVVETAAQVRRLEKIVAEIDREDVESVVEYIPLKHAKADELVKSLTALMGERRVEYVINPQDNKRVKLEDNRLAGLSIAADNRTNAIVARGTRARIDQLKSVIALLDVPSAGDTREIRTFHLTRLAPAEAAKRVEQLFAGANKNNRPIVMSDDELAAVTVVGDVEAIAEAAGLLRDIDGLASEAGAPEAGGAVERTVSVVPLRHLKPEAAVAAVEALLSKRQTAAMAVLPGSDGASVALAGPAVDVASAQAMIEAIDRPGRPNRQVRLMSIQAEDPAGVVAQARTLFERQADAADPTASDATADFDPGTGAVVLVGTPEAVSRFASVLDQLQAVAQPRPDVRLIELEHAKASETAEFLKGLAQGQIARAASPGAALPVFEAIDAINALLVSASPEQQQVIAQLVRTVDVPREQETPPLRILQLRTADAVNLANTLNQNYARRTAEERNAKPVTITADPQVNALLVACHPDLLPEIEGIVGELNDAGRLDVEGREIRIFPLRVARAVDLAKTIDEMFPAPPVPVDPRGRPRPELQKPREVVVRGDAQTNSIIVDAPAIRMSEFQQLVEQLDRQQISEAAEIRSWRLVHADLESAAATLRQLATSNALVPAGSRSSPVTVSTDRATSTLIVSGPPEAFDKIEELIETIDARRVGPATELRFFKLSTARAETVAPMLREILAGRIAEDLPDAASDLDTLLKVTADQRSNALIISAPEAIMPVAEELVKQLDSTAAAGSNDPTIRVRPLTFADSRELAQSLAQASSTMISKVTGQPMNVRLTAAPGSNALILVGLEPDLKEIEALIEPLDERPTLDAIDAKTFELAHAEATRIAPIVQNLLADQQETDPRIVLERLRRSRGQIDTTPRIRVEADTRTNSLIVSGPQRTVALAQTVIAQLDRPDAAADRVYASFTPANAEPAALAQTVQRVIEATQPSGRRNTLEIVPESQTGSLVLIGSEEETARAKALLKAWDDQALTAPAIDVRIVTLENSDARMVAPAVTAILQDRSRWPASLRSLARAGVSLAQPSAMADPAGNRLLLSAPAELMPVAERMIAELDTPRDGGGTVELRVFTLDRAKANDVAGALRGALEARAAVKPGEPRPSVSAEPSSNAVIVAATPDQLRHIEEIIKPLDTAASPEQQQVRTMFLRHARAEQVAPLVESLLAERELISPRDLPNWAQVDYLRARAQTAAGRPDVRVVADERMNAVVVAAPAAILNAAEQMVAQLDVETSAGAGSGRSVRVLTLENADAGELASSLEAMFQEQKAEVEPPSIRVNASSNSLIVRASDEQFAVIDSVVHQVDSATLATSRQMRSVPIDPSKASAEEVAAMLRRLLGRDGGPSVEVISVEELLKRSGGSPRSMAPVESVPWAATAVPIVPALGPVPILTLAGLLAAAAIGLPESERGPPTATAESDDARDVTIAVDPRTNSLIVIGSSRVVDRVAALALQAQDEIPVQPTPVRVLTLPDGTDPDRLRGLVQQTLARLAPPGGRPGQMAQRIGIVSDPATNALVVAAADPDFAIVADLVTALSRPSAVDRMTVKVYPLRTVTAERAATSLR
ncbi:MAG: hypothetical protein KDA22_12025, partial [Phycisphaerales bacterium]|nr:hypothetical protein [Phycisphaerales bacterium]